LWNLDSELDKLLVTEMKLNRPANLIIASGLQGDKGSLTLSFPGLSSILEVLLDEPIKYWDLFSYLAHFNFL
jgi:hypothetical protein